MNFIKAVKLMKKGKKMTRKNSEPFREAIDYIQIGLEDEYAPVTLSMFKDKRWARNAELWAEDYIARDWIEYKEKENDTKI